MKGRSVRRKKWFIKSERKYNFHVYSQLRITWLRAFVANDLTPPTLAATNANNCTIILILTKLNARNNGRRARVHNS